ncbi:hypothetical protein [Marinomonas algarum]|uniref:Uncharacterized protein n=1 Tax=Marinomonas algarum TaxID=2883105 RepID=A0A9X1LEV4_9GAMM|nr:hypothetical protein [Marinomonas algarum]MCB5161860.1 hypothetical protein [Marinomonas algarum]
MKKVSLQIVGVGSIAFMLSGCSLFFTDSANEYQTERSTGSTLEVPEGSLTIKDALVIPNEQKIADLEATNTFVTPRAPFTFYPMVQVGVSETDNAMVLTVPANMTQSKRIVSDFLTALHGAGSAIATETDNTIVTIPFDFHPQGWWANLWSDITRLYPKKTAFNFAFSEVEGEPNKTLVTIQYRDEQEAMEPTAWESPTENTDAYGVAVRLWGTTGRQLNQSSAYLSNRGEMAAFPIWVDHQGQFAVRLGNQLTPDAVESALLDKGFYLMPGEASLIAPVPSDEVERVGDVISLDVPTGNGESMKLFNVRRRNLDDVNWDKREYPYEILQQKAGDFLVIDVSATDYPELTSFHLTQRFVNKED